MAGTVKCGNGRRRSTTRDPARVRARPCHDCGAPPPSTVRPCAGIRVLIPLCRACHDKRHE